MVLKDAVLHAAKGTTPQPVLQVRDLLVAYDGKPAIHDISFDVHEAERIAIIGPNGAGKSTLLQAILGLLHPRAGSVTITGAGLRRVGYVPQREDIPLDFPVTVRDVVMMGRTRQIGWLRWPSRRHWQVVDEALARVGLSEYGNRQISELSGGQRRRVFVARALAQEADILILDEPFSGVDVSAQAGLLDVLERLNRQNGLTILLTTHDLELAFQHFDRVLALRHHIIAYGTPQEINTPQLLSQMYGRPVGNLLYVDSHECAPNCDAPESSNQP